MPEHAILQHRQRGGPVAGMVLGAVLAAPVMAADVPDGAALYADFCAVCHGADLEGAPDWRRPGPDGRLPAPPHDETGHTWHHGDRFLTDYVVRGGQAVLDDLGVDWDSGMPGFGDVLTEGEVAAILDYIKASWPEEIRQIQLRMTEAESDTEAP